MDPLQFETETVQVAKEVEVAQTVLTADQVRAAVCAYVCELYGISYAVTVRLPDFLQEQSLTIGVVRDPVAS